MDDAWFDAISRSVASRRTMLGGLGATLAALTAPGALAKKKKKKRRKKKKKKCASGAIRCGKVCVNASSDAQHCGGCGNQCGNGAACTWGVCTNPGPGACPSGQIRCGGQCVNLASDESHCGGCGNHCQGDLTCLGGTCGCAGAGDSRCGNSCVNLQTDDDHCGTCGNECTGSQTCQNGACVAAPCEYRCPYNNFCASDFPDGCCYDHECGSLGSCGDDNRCFCSNPNQGICTSSSGARTCHVCCGTGSHTCPGDKVCVDSSAVPGWFTCSCPPGKKVCPALDHCQNENGVELTRCGANCTDCTATDSVCCAPGVCVKGCEPGASGSCGLGTPCPGNDCQPCQSGWRCCRKGGIDSCISPEEQGPHLLCPN